MGSLDRQVRNEAATQRASIFGHNYSDDTDYDLKQGAYTYQGGYSDLCPLVGVRTSDGANISPTPEAINCIRILQPHQGEIVECYIDFVMARLVTTDGYAPFDYSTMGVAIGDFTNNDFMTPRTSYTPDELAASWKRISGKDSEIYRLPGDEAVLYASRLNLLPELKKAGDPKYVEDGFNLLIYFNNGEYAPLGSAGTGFDFNLDSLRVVMSITGVK